jgi:hypothetical protein
VNVSELIGLGSSIIVLAGLSVIIINGGNSSKVLGAGLGGFADLIRAATLQSKAK